MFLHVPEDSVQNFGVVMGEDGGAVHDCDSRFALGGVVGPEVVFMQFFEHETPFFLADSRTVVDDSGNRRRRNAEFRRDCHNAEFFSFSRHVVLLFPVCCAAGTF